MSKIILDESPSDEETETMHQRMRRLGVDMSWYKPKDHSRDANKKLVALNDDRCSVLSIYLLMPGGRLHTTKTDGEAYMLARVINTKVTRNVYLCAHCKKQFKSYAQAKEHYEENLKKY